MKKYVFIAFILIFGTSITSGYMTYIKTNPKSDIKEVSIPQNIVENVDNVSKNTIIEEQNQKTIQQVTQIQEQPSVEVKKETHKTENNNNTPQLTKENTDKEVVEQPKQQATTEVKDLPNTEGNYTEIEVSVAEKKECDENTHGMSAGNTGLWFETKDKAIATYKAEIKVWGDKWTNDEISDDEYYENCPYGYEVWSCPYCGKWTLNYYLDK